MEIKITEREKEVIEMTRKGEEYHALLFFSPDQEKCSLELEITDPYKCAHFIAELFCNQKDFIKEECGFQIKAVSSIGVYSDLQNLKEDVHNSIEEKFNEHKL